MFRKLIILLLGLSLFFSSVTLWAGQGGGRGQEQSFMPEKSSDQQIAGVLSDLILTLTTRQNVIDPDGIEVMKKAVNAGARAFIHYAGKENKSARFEAFALTLRSALAEYHQACQASAPGLTGAGVRGAAMHDLLGSLFASAEQAGVAPDLLDFAMLGAFARFEEMVAEPDIEAKLSMEERELVDLLLIFASRQITFRSWLKEDLTSKLTLDMDPSLILPEELYALSEKMLQQLSMSLEEELSDRLVLADAQQLVGAQFNQEARHDMAMARLSIQIFYNQGQRDSRFTLQTLASRMDSVGGIMAGMTPEKIAQSGVAYTGLAYDWVRPEMTFSYSPVNSLIDRLVQVDGTVPQAPDFNIFEDPYRAVFEVGHDMSQSDSIFRGEERLAIDRTFGVTGQALTMKDRFILRREDRKRRMNIMTRLKGVPEVEKGAVRMLLTPAFL